MYQGNTKELSREQRLENELRAVLEILAEQPLNSFWVSRLEALSANSESPSAWERYYVAGMTRATNQVKALIGG